MLQQNYVSRGGGDDFQLRIYLKIFERLFAFWILPGQIQFTDMFVHVFNRVKLKKQNPMSYTE